MQGLLQLLTALGGIIVIRRLEPNQYALYTIAFSAVGALAQMSSSGIIDGVMGIGGRVIGEPARMAALVATALRLRWRMALIVGPPITLVTIVLLLRTGAGIGETACLMALIGTILAVELQASVRLVGPWLQSRFHEIQRIELVGGCVRLGLIAVVPGLWPRALAALACTVAASFVQLRQFRRRLAPPGPALPDPAMRREIIAVIRRQWLNDVNAMIFSQVGVWLLSLLASPFAVAEYGAFGRVAAIFTVITTSLHRVLLARYARAQRRAEVLGWYRATLAAAVALVTVPPLLALAFPAPILSIFGPSYRGFTGDFQLFCASAGVAAMVTVTWWLNASRGWIAPSWVIVPCQAVCFTLLVLWLGADTLRGLVGATIGANLALIVTNLLYSWYRFRRFVGQAEPSPASSP